MSEIIKKLEKYNYWKKQEPKTVFLRSFYLDKINKYIGNNLIKVIVGQRRVGKSYILRQIIQSLINKGINRKNIFYLNKELVDFDEIKDYQDLNKLIKLYKKELKIKGKVYVLLDEIQEIKQWEKIVNSLSQDHKEKYEVFITGSNSKMLSGELATFLSGRYILFNIYPFSFTEYADCFNLEKDKKNFLKYLQVGGLPELLKLDEEEMRRHYISSLEDTIVVKDIINRYKIKDAYLLKTIFKYIADNIGNLFSVNNVVNYLISDKIKTNFETVANYIEYLEDAFLIYGVDRYDIKGKSILARSKKYYLNDLSFKNYASSSFDYGPGKHLENVVFLYYKRLGYKIYVGKIRENEVDFVAEKGDEKQYIQVAYSLLDKKVIDREYGSLKAIDDNYEKFVISLDDVLLGNKNGIKHLLAWDL